MTGEDSVQVHAEKGTHQINSALDLLADNAEIFQLHINWYELKTMAVRVEQIRRLYDKLDMQRLRGELSDIIKASRENTDAQGS